MLRLHLLWWYFYGVPLLPFHAARFEHHIIWVQVFQGMWVDCYLFMGQVRQRMEQEEQAEPLAYG